MAKWKIITGGVIVLGGLGALCVVTNPDQARFETYAIERVQQELCPKVPLGLADDCPRLVAENQGMLKGWIRQNTQQRNFGLFTLYESSLSVRELVPEPARPLLAFVPLPNNYRLQTIGILGRFIVYGAQSEQP
jgi:hypothetical protein